MWEVTAKGPDGTRVWRANAVISAVGFLSRPNLPDIPGWTSSAGRPSTPPAGRRTST